MRTTVPRRRRPITGADRTLRVWRALPFWVGSGSEVGEDGEHAAVPVVVGGQAELGEDVADVLFDRAGGQHRPPAATGNDSAMTPLPLSFRCYVPLREIRLRDVD